MKNESTRDHNDCTENMVKVIELIPLGYNKPEISKMTGINVNTVKDTIKQLYDLFKVNSFSELTRVAIQLGYFTETRVW